MRSHEYPLLAHPDVFWQHFPEFFNEKPFFLTPVFHSPFFGSYQSPVAV